jgi:hypothetical protein
MPWILGAIGAAAAALMVLAWWVGGSERALFAHAISLAIAVGLVTLAANIFDPRGRPPLGNPSSPSRAGASRPRARLAEVTPVLVALAALVLLGVGYRLLR